jgi:hypothetical protein
MKGIIILATLTMAAVALRAGRKETMCVMRKDGTCKCKASGKIEMEAVLRHPEERSQADIKAQEISVTLAARWESRLAQRHLT